MHNKWMGLAATLSKKSDHPQHKIGAVLVRKNRAINTGFNKIKTHTHSNSKYKSIHAEFDCIFGLTPKELKSTILYLYRETKNGDMALAKPCEFCDQLLRNFGVGKVIYTTPDGPKELRYLW